MEKVEMMSIEEEWLKPKLIMSEPKKRDAVYAEIHILKYARSFFVII